MLMSWRTLPLLSWRTTVKPSQGIKVREIASLPRNDYSGSVMANDSEAISGY